MLTIPIEQYLIQLERIISHLKAGRPVLLTHSGRAYHELIPVPTTKSMLDRVVRHNLNLGWRGEEARKIVFMYQGQPLALIQMHTRCGRIQRFISMIDDITSHPERIIEAFLYLEKYQSSSNHLPVPA